MVTKIRCIIEKNVCECFTTTKQKVRNTKAMYTMVHTLICEWCSKCRSVSQYFTKTGGGIFNLIDSIISVVFLFHIFFLLHCDYQVLKLHD